MNDIPRHHIRRTLRVLVLLLLSAPFLASAESGQAKGLEAQKLAFEGRKLSANEAAELEAHLVTEPDDLQTRVKLVGYYAGSRSEETRVRLVDHAVWIVRHHPGSEAAGLREFVMIGPIPNRAAAKLIMAWMEQIETAGDDPRVLENAASFFFLSDRELARELLEKGKALEPSNPHWPHKLGQLYSLGLVRGEPESNPDLAHKALQEFEEALLATDAEQRRFQLVEVAKTAVEAGELEKARAYAQELLTTAQQGGWNSGNAIHHGHLILGRIALREGIGEQAKEHLLQAGATHGSPQLSSFGPNMMLAKELLEQGETEAVLEYFELCGKFWKSSQGRLEQWAEVVKAGGIPDFGANLHY